MGWGGGRRRTGNDCFQKDLRWMRAFLFPFPSPFFFFFFGFATKRCVLQNPYFPAVMSFDGNMF